MSYILATHIYLTIQNVHDTALNIHVHKTGQPLHRVDNILLYNTKHGGFL